MDVYGKFYCISHTGHMLLVRLLVCKLGCGCIRFPFYHLIVQKAVQQFAKKMHWMSPNGLLGAPSPPLPTNRGVSVGRMEGE